MKPLFSKSLTALALSASMLSAPLYSASAMAEEKSEFTLAWSIYVGWMPWDYADYAGVIDKWADKYGIDINVVQVNDYVESINQYTAGQFDATVMTNMDALTIPAASGVDSTAVIVGDFSNGNDGVVLKNGKQLADIKGQNVNLVELSVSHYLLARGLESVDLSERDAIDRMAFTPSKRTGEYLMWVDTLASLQRLAYGVGLSALVGLSIGIANGMIPLVRSSLSPFVTAIVC